MRPVNVILGPPPRTITCPLCGWQDGLIDLRAEGLGFGCSSCYFEGSEREILDTIDEQLFEAWQYLPDDALALLDDDEAVRPLRALAAELLQQGVRIDLVELSVRGVNVHRRAEGRPSCSDMVARRIVRAAERTLARQARGRAA